MSGGLGGSRRGAAARGRLLRATWPVLGLTLLLSACSGLQFAYNHAGTAARYLAGDYLDFDGAQSEEFQLRFTRVHDWHRRHELPLYAALLRQAAARLEAGLTADDAHWAVASVRERYRATTMRMAVEAAPLLAALTPAQIGHMEAAVAEKNVKYEQENLAGDEKKVMKKRMERISGYFEDWLGPLSAAQQRRIERYAVERVESTALYFAERRRWQHEALLAIRAARDAGSLRETLAASIAHPEASRPAEVQRAFERDDEALVGLIMDLEPGLSKEQRARAAARMRQYADDFAALSSEGQARAAS